MWDTKTEAMFGCYASEDEAVAAALAANAHESSYRLADPKSGVIQLE